MKRIWITMITLALMLGLCACGNGNSLFSREYTFPESSTILGVDVTGCNKEEAWAKLEAAADGYTLELTVDGTTVTIPGKDIGLNCSYEDFMAGADALEAGTEADFSQVVHFNDAKLRLFLGRSLNKSVQDAALVYDEASGQFLLEAHAEGCRVDNNALAVTLRDTIRTLTPQQALTGVSEVLLPFWTADMPEAQEALELANKLLNVQLTYDFGDDTDHPIPVETLLSFVDLGADGFTPAVDQAAVEAYAAELAAIYSTDAGPGPFKTTHGEGMDMLLPYESCEVDIAGLAQDIVTCMQEGISGKRTAPYLGNSIKDMPYGGTYIEIDLTSQHLWFYKEGECIVSTNLVSGNAAARMNTPTGVYRIYSKSRSTYLEGADYRSFVYYWMPFTGGYGMHDALWRDEFGGDIYLNDGSHGCVNLPLSAAQTIYENAPVGTEVILYGGEGSTEPREQEILGTTEYDIADDTKPFKLKMRSRYAWPEFFYESDNPEVATVAEDGTVTVTGIGTANITVIATTEGRNTAGTVTVTIAVHSACEEGRHAMSPSVMVSRPSCQPGLEKASCRNCDYFTEEQIDPIAEHSYDDGVSCSVCGEADPDYTEPAAEE